MVAGLIQRSSSRHRCCHKGTPTPYYSCSRMTKALGFLLLLVVVWQSPVQAKPSSAYSSSNVNDDEVVIDQLNRYLRSRGLRDQPPPAPRHHVVQDINEKIKFAVGPRDPRYYLPVLEEGSQDQGSPLRPLLPEDLALLGPAGLSEAFPQERFQVPRGYNDYQPLAQEVVYPQDYSELPGLGYQPVPERPLQSPGAGELVDLQDLYGGGALSVPDLRGLSETEVTELLGLPQVIPEDVPRIKNLEAVESKPAAVQDSEAPKKKEAKKAATSQPESVNYLQRSHASAQIPLQPHVHSHNQGGGGGQLSDVYFTAIVAGCTAVAVSAVVGAGMCWYRLNKSHRAAADAEYPAYGVTGPNKDLSPSSTDRKLAQSAHMYHYQHQKQQMIALEKSSGAGERHGSASDVDSEEEGEEGDYTVYECPGLAPTGEMEVKNPLFHDDPTPATPAMLQHDAKDTDIEDEDEKIN